MKLTLGVFLEEILKKFTVIKEATEFLEIIIDNAAQIVLLAL